MATTLVTRESLTEDLRVIHNKIEDVEKRAKSENRNPNPDERSFLESMTMEGERLMRAIDRQGQLDELSKPSPRLTNPGNPIGADGLPQSSRISSKGEQWVDNRGNPVHVLDNTQKVADLYRNKRAVTNSGETLSLGRFLRAMVTGQWDNARAEQRVMQTEGTSFYGGYTVPDVLLADVVDLARAKSVAFQAGMKIVPMDHGDQLKIVRVASDATYEVKAEGAAFTGSNITFDRLSFVPKTVGTTIPISRELWEDSTNLEQALTMALANGLANKIDSMILYGAIPGILGLGLSESINEVNSVGTPTSWVKWLDGMELIWEDNHEPNTLILCPRDKATLEGLQQATTNAYLEPPESIRNLRRFKSTNIPRTLGAGGNESYSLLGDFTKYIFVMRQDAQIEMSKDEGDSFQQHSMKIKITMRCDAQPEYDGAFCRLNGITA